VRCVGVATKHWTEDGHAIGVSLDVNDDVLVV